MNHPSQRPKVIASHIAAEATIVTGFLFVLAALPAWTVYAFIVAAKLMR